MSLPIYQRVAVTDAGDVIPGAEYTVINENTGVAAPIYSDRTGATLLTAPYFADSAGTIQFFIAQGTTFRVAASGGVGTYTDRYVYGVAEAVLVQADGDISFYENTGTTPKFFWDASTESLELSSLTSYVTTNSGKAVGGLDIEGTYSGAGTYGGGISFGTGGTGRSAIAAYASHATDNDANGLAFFTHSSSGGSVDAAEAMRITNAGNVGIGTTTPFGKLSVNVNSGAPSSSGNMANGLTIHNTDGGRAIQLGINETGAYSYLQSAYVNSANVATPLAFFTGAAERLRIDSSGNVGIGTSSPAVLSHVSSGYVAPTGGVDANIINLLSNAASGANYVGLGLLSGNNGGSFIHFGDTDQMDIGGIAYFHDNNRMQFTTNGSERMRIDSAGNVGIGTISPAQLIHGKTTSGNAFVRIERASQTTGQVGLQVGGGTGSTDWFTYMPTSSNDLAFFGNSAERMRIDSSGNVGIGTSSPSGLAKTLNIDGGLAGSSIALDGGDNFSVFYTGATADDPTSVFSNTGFKFATATAKDATGFSEKMRIDASGNLLVGKTATTLSVAGTYISASGSVGVTRASDDCLTLNRTGTDGAIASFYKGSVTVGSIGTYNGVPYIGYAGGAGGGIMFNGLSIEPTSLGATRTNGANDIGSTSYRWKDLHLSGGVVFDAAGGTGTSTSTTLDSYEEGTWTPFIDNGTLTIQGTTYTKVGRLVTVQAYLSNISIPNTTATFYIKGLPFAQTSTGGSYNAGQISYCSNGNLSGLGLLTHPGTSSLYMHYIDGTGHAGQLTNANYLARNTTGHIIFQMTYMSN